MSWNLFEVSLATNLLPANADYNCSSHCHTLSIYLGLLWDRQHWYFSYCTKPRNGWRNHSLLSLGQNTQARYGAFTDEIPLLKPILSWNFLNPGENSTTNFHSWQKVDICYKQLCICGGKKSPDRIVLQLCTGVDIRDIVTPCQFASHQLKHFRLAGVEF